MVFHEAEVSVLNPDVKYRPLGEGTWTSGSEQSLEPDDRDLNLALLLLAM